MQKIEYSMLLVCFWKGDLCKTSGSIRQERIAAVAPSGKERVTSEEWMGEVHASFYAYLMITFEFFTTCIHPPPFKINVIKIKLKKKKEFIGNSLFCKGGRRVGLGCHHSRGDGHFCRRCRGCYVLLHLSTTCFWETVILASMGGHRCRCETQCSHRND